MEELEEKLKCPKCNSTQLTADKRGFNTGKAVAGAVLTGGIGLLAGLHGKDNIVVYCMSCGESWKPSEYAKKVQQSANDKRAKEDLEKLKSRQNARSLLVKQRHEFIHLYKRDKSEALNFAKVNKLPRHGSNNADIIYNSFRADLKKETINQIIGGLVFVLVVILLFYMCSDK
ncbi:hypothetical protein [Sphingobacterium multivorum]|uniref:hypothetical protein n=1 Tax=Sphingobacterium multivorum TaxID=28454 RepID=UPI00368F5B33